MLKQHLDEVKRSKFTKIKRNYTREKWSKDRLKKSSVKDYKMKRIKKQTITVEISGGSKQHVDTMTIELCVIEERTTALEPSVKES